MSLSVPLWVSTDDVIQRLQLNSDLTGTTNLINDAIQSAILHLESVMDSKLARQSLDCTFFLDSSKFSGIQPNGIYRIELPNGFVRTDTPVVVTVSNQTMEDFWSVLDNTTVESDAYGPFGDFTSADPALYRIDYERGYVFMSAAHYSNRYARVQCDVGFEPGTTPVPTSGLIVWDASTIYNPGNLVVFNNATWVNKVTTAAGESPLTTPAKWGLAYIAMENIPNEVYEAVMAYTPVALNMSQTTNRNAEAQPQYQALADHAELLVKKYLRLLGFAYRPMWVNTVAPS